MVVEVYIELEAYEASAVRSCKTLHQGKLGNYLRFFDVDARFIRTELAGLKEHLVILRGSIMGRPSGFYRATNVVGKVHTPTNLTGQQACQVTVEGSNLETVFGHYRKILHREIFPDRDPVFAGAGSD